MSCPLTPVSLAEFGNSGFSEIAASLVVALTLDNTFVLDDPLYFLCNAFKLAQLASAVLVFAGSEKIPRGISLTE